MDERVGHSQANGTLSPYRHFTRSEWAALRADTPLTLTIEDLKKAAWYVNREIGRLSK